MILDVTLKLEAVLAGAVAANQPEVHVDYVDWTKDNVQTPPTPFRVALNNTTDVTILAAPVLNPRREPVGITIYNKDTAAVTVTVKTDDGTTERIIEKKQLAAGETLVYEKGAGPWQVF